MFFEDLEISADILIETKGVGAGLALRIRNACFFRGVTPGVYLFVGDSTPAIPAIRNPNDPNCGFEGGIPSLPNAPMAGSQWKICTNSYCNGAPIASGKLPAAWGVGEWHRLALMTVGNNATASMDGQVFWSGAMAAAPTIALAGPRGQSRLPDETAVPSCAANMTLLPHGEMLVGHDYRQVQLQGDPSDIKHCVDACCADTRCTSWAVATSDGSSTCAKNTVCCWLKEGTTPAKVPGTGESAAGYKPGKHHGPAPPIGPPHPPLPFKGAVPLSGWAGLVTTLGGVQYDDFKLEGRAKGGGAVDACGTTAPAAGDQVVSSPCDAPNMLHSWEKLPGGQLQLTSTTLCLGADAAGAAILVACAGDDSALLSHDRATGRIKNSGSCLDIAGYPGEGGRQWPAAVANASCIPIPADMQQHQFNPQTGALRPKGSPCVAGFAATTNQYENQYEIPLALFALEIGPRRSNSVCVQVPRLLPGGVPSCLSVSRVQTKELSSRVHTVIPQIQQAHDVWLERARAWLARARAAQHTGIVPLFCI